MKRNSHPFAIGVLVAVTLLLLIGSAIAAQTLKVGDIVFAEWTTNGWYHGKIAHKCPLGWFIKFDDGDEKCCRPDQVVKDVVPVASTVKVGSAVLAEWTNGRYYPGSVTAISGGSYSILFDDGDTRSVTLSQIRLRD